MSAQTQPRGASSQGRPHATSLSQEAQLPGRPTLGAEALTLVQLRRMPAGGPGMFPGAASHRAAVTLGAGVGVCFALLYVLRAAGTRWLGAAPDTPSAPAQAAAPAKAGTPRCAAGADHSSSPRRSPRRSPGEASPSLVALQQMKPRLELSMGLNLDDRLVSADDRRRLHTRDGNSGSDEIGADDGRWPMDVDERERRRQSGGASSVR
jgi:hypothetical protein